MIDTAPFAPVPLAQAACIGALITVTLFLIGGLYIGYREQVRRGLRVMVWRIRKLFGD